MQGADLILTTEGFQVTVPIHDRRYSFSEVYEPADGMIGKRLSKIADKYGCYIAAGMFRSDGSCAYNSLVLFDKKGKIQDIYDKVHLSAGEEKQFTAGSHYKIWKTDIGNLGPLICWDLQFPEAARILALKNADIILNPTWGWELRFGVSRAYENSIPVAAAMMLPRDGYIKYPVSPSMVLNHMGERVWTAQRQSRHSALRSEFGRTGSAIWGRRNNRTLVDETDKSNTTAAGYIRLSDS